MQNNDSEFILRFKRQIVYINFCMLYMLPILFMKQFADNATTIKFPGFERHCQVS